MRIRSYTPADVDNIARIYRAAASEAGGQAYSPAQAAAWARTADDRAWFTEQLAQGVTLVAESDTGAPVAFGQLHPSDRIAMLYTAPGYVRASYASTIYRMLEDRARESGAEVLHTESSLVARPFFEKQGFEVIGTERVVRAGVTIERLRMTKMLAEPRGPGA